MRQVIVCRPEWLAAAAPHIYKPAMLADDGARRGRGGGGGGGGGARDVAPGQSVDD